jgi:predicted nucleic acid-binding protein
MAIYFFDTSALVKRYITEPGSAWIRQICEARDSLTDAQSNVIFISEITIVESAAAFAILVRTDIIPKRKGKDAYGKFVDQIEREYRVIGLTRALVRAAADLTQNYPLKAYDAMQLAIALDTKNLLKANGITLVFVSGDDQLLQAARAEGMSTENPFDHTTLDR